MEYPPLDAKFFCLETKNVFVAFLGAYSDWILLLYFVIQFALACWTYGISVASGLFLPCLLIGAAWGRMLGSILNYFFPETVKKDLGDLAGAGALGVWRRPYVRKFRIGSRRQLSKY